MNTTHLSPPPSPRGLRALGWLGPGALLVLMPKCPACMAGYIAVLTGLGVSLSTAALVRYGLMTLCVGALAFLVIKRARRLANRRRSTCCGVEFARPPLQNISTCSARHRSNQQTPSPFSQIL